MRIKKKSQKLKGWKGWFLDYGTGYRIDIQGNLEYRTGYGMDSKGNLEYGRGDGMDVQKDLEYEGRIRPRF